MQPLPPDARIDMPSSYLAETCPITQSTIGELINIHFRKQSSPYLLAEVEDTRNCCGKGNRFYSDGESIVSWFRTQNKFLMPTYHELCDKVRFYFVKKNNNQLIKKRHATYSDHTHVLYELDPIPNNPESMKISLRKHRCVQINRIASFILGGITNLLMYRLLPVSQVNVISIAANAILFGYRIKKYFDNKGFHPIDLSTRLASIGFSIASIVRVIANKTFSGTAVVSLPFAIASLGTNLGLKTS